MAGFADTLRGDGLARVHRALDGLEADPFGLDHARTRFSQPPPSYVSNPSGTTTRSASPEPPNDEQRRREQREQRFQRRRKLMDERAASLPLQQFDAQVDEEKKRIWNANPRTNWMSKIPIAGTEEKQAIETIKERWAEQGIWKDGWDEMAAGRGYMGVGKWKHEEPLELESESETDTEAESPPPTFSIFGVPQKPPQPKLRRPKSDDERRQIAERRAIWEREREASRPYYQFIYQISKGRERTQDESTNGEGADAADINTRAYENVKSSWIKRGIWNTGWGILPGMSWKHEEALEEEAADGPIPVSETALKNGQPPVNHEAANELFAPLFGPLSPVESNHREASAAMTTSQQGLPADIDLAGLENGDAEHPPSTPNLPRPIMGKQVLHPTKGQALRPSRRKQSQKYGQPQPVASASLGLVHPSKVSKAAGKTKPGRQRRLNISQKVSSGGLPLSSGVDAAEPQPSPPPDRVTPRRSKRIQPPAPSVAKDPAKTASTDPSKRAVRSKPERKVASNLTARSSAKPQGVLKGRPAKTARGKARKN